MSTRIKICGITRSEDALAAVAAGADAIGLVFYAPSPRAVTVAQAAAIVRALPPFVTATGLFVNASRCEIEETLDAVPLDLLQFHGDESPAECARYRRPFLKALRMAPGDDIAARAAEYGQAAGILLDAYVEGIYGGTGEAFDWNHIPALPRPLVLAGGLTPDNVFAAVRAARPYAVDVSGGVEQSRGIKSAARIQAFIDAVRRADAALR